MLHVPDKSIAILIKHIESLSQVIIAVVFTHFNCNNVEELRKVHSTVAITIQLSVE